MSQKKFGDLRIVSLLNIKKKYYGEILYAELDIEHPISGSVDVVFSVSAKPTLIRAVSSSFDILADTELKSPYKMGPDEYKIISCKASGGSAFYADINTRPTELLYFEDGLLFRHTMGYSGIVANYFTHYKHQDFVVYDAKAELAINLGGKASSTLTKDYALVNISAQDCNLIFATSNKIVHTEDRPLALESGTLFNHLHGTEKLIPYYNVQVNYYRRFTVKANVDITLGVENSYELTKTYYKRWVPISANGSSGTNVRRCTTTIFPESPSLPPTFDNGILFDHLAGLHPKIHHDSGNIYDVIIHKLPKRTLAFGKVSGDAVFYTSSKVSFTWPKAIMPCTAFGHAVSDGQAILDSEEFTIHNPKARLDIAPEFSANTYRAKVGKGQAKLIFGTEVSSQWGIILPSAAEGGSVFSADANGYRAKVLSASAGAIFDASGEPITLKLSPVWTNIVSDGSAWSRSFYRVMASGDTSLRGLANVSSIEGITSSGSAEINGEAIAYRCLVLSANGHAEFAKDHVKYTTIYCHIASADGESSLDTLVNIKAIYSGSCIGNSITDGSTYETWTYRVTASLPLVFGYKAFQPPMDVLRAVCYGESYFDPEVLRSELKFFLYVEGVYNRLRWNRYRNAKKYSVYMSSIPGEPYIKVGEAPAIDKPYYDIKIDMVPRNLRTVPSGTGVKLAWDEPLFKGAPATFKVIPEFEDGFAPMSTRTAQQDLVWVDDELPEGAIWLNQDGLSLSNYCRHGTNSFKVSAESGSVEPRFVNAPEISGHIIVWVYIQEDSVPDAFWFTLINNKGEERRLFWAQNRFKNDVLGEKEKRYCEELPVPDTWAPIIFHTDDLELTGITGMGIGVSKKEGSASIYIDSICYTPQPVYKIPFPHVPLRRERRYSIYRNEELIGYSDSLEYNDNRVLDIGSGTDAFSYQPIYSIRHNELDDTIRISWTVPSSEGTEYDYKVISHDALGGVSSAATLTTTVAIDHAKTEIIISSENTPEYSVITTDSVFVQEDIIYGDTYRYTIISYDSEGTPTSTVIKTYTVPYGSCLDSFVLDESPLA